MTAPVRIEASEWGELRYATLARLMGFADADHALVKVARIRAWQTEHYTPESPTHVVDPDIVESALGTGGAAALVRAKLAEEHPDGLHILESEGRIEWLWQRRQASAKGGEATARKARAGSRPAPGPTASRAASIGEPPDINRPVGPGPGQPEPGPEPGPKPSPLTLLPEEEDLSLPHAIPPRPEQAPTAPALPEASPPPILPGSIARAEACRQLIGDAWQLAGDAFRELGREGIEPTAPDAWSGMPSAGSEGMKRLIAIVDRLLVGDEPDVDGARAVIANRIAVAKAEGRAKSPPTRRWLTPMAIWSPVAFEHAATISPEQVHAAAPATAGQRAGPRGSAERAPSNEPPRRQPKTLSRP